MVWVSLWKVVINLFSWISSFFRLYSRFFPPIFLKFCCFLGSRRSHLHILWRENSASFDTPIWAHGYSILRFLCTPFKTPTRNMGDRRHPWARRSETFSKGLWSSKFEDLSEKNLSSIGSVRNPGLDFRTKSGCFRSRFLLHSTEIQNLGWK